MCCLAWVFEAKENIFWTSKSLKVKIWKTEKSKFGRIDSRGFVRSILLTVKRIVVNLIFLWYPNFNVAMGNLLSLNNHFLQHQMCLAMKSLWSFCDEVVTPTIIPYDQHCSLINFYLYSTLCTFSLSSGFPKKKSFFRVKGKWK